MFDKVLNTPPRKRFFITADIIDFYIKTVLIVHDGRHYHIETSPLIWRANQWTGFYMTGTSTIRVTHFYNQLSMLINETFPAGKSIFPKS